MAVKSEWYNTKHIQIHCDMETNKKKSRNMNGMWLFYSSTDTIFRIGPHNRESDYANDTDIRIPEIYKSLHYIFRKM